MADKTFHLLPPQSWELAVCTAGGLTLSQFRFVVAFVLSVAVGAALRVIPTVRGASWRLRRWLKAQQAASAVARFPLDQLRVASLLPLLADHPPVCRAPLV